MKASFHLSGFFAVCFVFITACDKKTEPSRVADRSETPPHGDATNEKPRVTNEEALNAQTNEQNEEHELLTVTLHNSSDGDIDETAIVFGKHSCTSGIVGKGYSKGYVGWPYSVGTNAMVRWRDSAKVKREARVEFSKIYDPKVPGQLIFTIAGTNVTVKFEKLSF